MSGIWWDCADGCPFRSSSGRPTASLMQMLMIHIFLIFKAPLFYFCLGNRRNWCGNFTPNRFSSSFTFPINDFAQTHHKKTHFFKVLTSHAHYQLMTVSSRSTILLVDGDAPWEPAACPCALSGSKWVSAGRSRSWHDSVHTFLMASSQNKSPVCFLI